MTGSRAYNGCPAMSSRTMVKAKKAEEGGEGEEHGQVHIAHGGNAHHKAHKNVQHHAEEIEYREFGGAPFPLQGGADPIVEVQQNGQPEKIGHPAAGDIGHEDKGDQPPDLPVEDAGGAEGEQVGGGVDPSHAEHIQDKHQDVADDDVFHEPGDPQAGMLAAETLQPLLQCAQRNDLLRTMRWTDRGIPPVLALFYLLSAHKSSTNCKQRRYFPGA